MKIPHEFYLNQTQSNIGYSSSCTGHLDVQRALQAALDPWILSTPPRSLIPKKLILTDCNLKAWSWAKRIKLESEFISLMRSGFSLYIWLENEETKALTEANLWRYLYIQDEMNIPPTPPDCVLDQASIKNHFSRDQLFLLDNYWCECLYTDNVRTTYQEITLVNVARPTTPHHPESPSRITFVSDNKIKISQEELLQATTLTFKGVKLQHIKDFFSHSNVRLDQLRNVRFHSIKDKDAALSLSLRDLLTVAPHLESIPKNIQFNDTPESVMPVNALKEISLNRYRDQWATPLLQSSPQTRSLSITSILYDEDFLTISPKPGSLSHLILLKLDCFSKNSSLASLEKFFDSLLRAAPHLKSLCIVGLTNLDENFFKDKAHQLEVLQLRSSTVDLFTLAACLNHTPKLKSLSLPSCKLSTQLTAPLPSLRYLEDITDPEPLSAEHLLAFIRSAPDLKKVEIKFNCRPKKIPNIPTDLFLKLETLVLSSGTSEETYCSWIYACAPYLKSLTFDYSFTRETIKALKKTHQLENLTIEYDGHAALLTELLQNTPFLKKLFINKTWGAQGMNSAPANLALSANQLTTLRTLVVSQSHFNTSHLGKLSVQNWISLLEAAPNLEEINGIDTIECIDAVDEEIDQLATLLMRKPSIWFKNKILTHLDKKLYAACLREPNASILSEPIKPEENDLFMPAFDGSDDDEQAEDHNSPRTVSQKKIIEKLSQYWAVTQTGGEFIKKIQKGICLALAHYFKQSTEQQWAAFIINITSWNGRADTLNETLHQDFEQLTRTVFTHYKSEDTFHYSENTFHYVGDQLIAYLSTLRHLQCCILCSPWHAIAVRREDERTFTVYDPNHDNGAITIRSRQLELTLHASIGRIVSIVSNISVTTEPPLIDVNYFIAKGGLFALFYCANHSHIMQQLRTTTEYTTEALEGLLLKDIKNCPAWYRGISHPHPEINAFVHSLLSHLQHRYPIDYEKKLNESLNSYELPSLNVKRVATLVPTPPLNGRQSVSVRPSMGLDKIIQKRAMTIRLEEQFATWETKHQRKVDVATYCIEILHVPNVKVTAHAVSTSRGLSAGSSDMTGSLDSADKARNIGADFRSEQLHKKLIQLSSPEQRESLLQALLHHCHESERPVFYIHKPENLVCSAPFIQKADDGVRGNITDGPGGPLYEFLKTNQGKQPGPVLIINYDNFEADDLVRYNQLLDERRFADGVLLSDETLVIGLMDTQRPHCYQGADFYSRFDSREPCPFSANTIQQHLPTIPEISEAASNTESTVCIDLYKAQDWEQRLLGRWQIDGDALRFEEGSLKLALLQRKPIELRNAPWSNPDFQRFCTNLRRNGIERDGNFFKLRQDQLLLRGDGYDWETLKTYIELHDSVLIDNASLEAGQNRSVARSLVPLNYAHFHRFFPHVDLDANADRLIHKPGFIASATHSTLHVQLTATLTENQWAMLLKACQDNQCTLVAYRAATVEMPPAFNCSAIKTSAPKPWDPDQPTAVSCISSTDIDMTLAIIQQRDPAAQWCIIDISECAPADLLETIDATYDPTTKYFKFKRSMGALQPLFEKQHRVILKGHFSEELIDALTPLMQSHQEHHVSQCVLIANKPHVFDHIPSHVEHVVSISEKELYLKNEYPDLDWKQLSEFIQEPLAKLKTRADYLTIYPEGDSNQAFAGMSHLNSSDLKPEPILTQDTYSEAKAFIESRRSKINQILAHRPYVFITGLSGVGKSTFVEQELCTSEDQLFSGAQCMQAFAEATPKPNGRCFLFLDEANLIPRQWSEFEGLFSQAPGILINKKFHALTPKHKVIFAGNPISYGDERTLAPFFLRHGGSVVFEPLSIALIFEKILKPILTNQRLSTEDRAAVNQTILQAYAFICEHSSDKLLISPRELQMMALLTLINHQQFPHTDISTHAQCAVYSIAYPLFPNTSQYAYAKKQFEQRFKPQYSQALLPLNTANLNSTIFITPSRQPIIHQLQERLLLREWRIEHATELNTMQRYGGLGGHILEGQPGVGKSLLVLAVLQANGYQQQYLDSPPEAHDKIFYVLGANLSVLQKKQLLSKAFDEGAVVLADEINSSPMMEQFLNSLLMGANPDKPLSEQRPRRLGFTLFGTQNPMTMAGRRAMSTALSRRTTTTLVSDYTHEELLSLLCSHYEMPSDEAALTLSVYERQRDYAMNQHLNPIPCFRNLDKIAKQRQTMMHKAHPSNRTRVEALNQYTLLRPQNGGNQRNTESTTTMHALT